MLAMHPNRANLSKFHSATPTILYGRLLDDVRQLQSSILQNGLLKPLVVSQNQGRLVVIDGRKRLMALRRLSFFGLLPVHLSRIPYVIIDQHQRRESEVKTRQVSPERAYTHIKDQQSQGKSLSEIALATRLTKDTVRALLTLDSLSRDLREAFLARQITLKQALAFATLQNAEAQDTLFTQLGHLAKDDEILKAIVSGATVLPIHNDDFIILPSRGDYGTRTQARKLAA